MNGDSFTFRPRPDEDREVATTCDECDKPFYYHETAIMRYTGEQIDGHEVVRFLCFECADEM